MKTTIYYFSATGNSLQLARRIASNLETCDLVPMASTLGNEMIEPSSERIGLIFPVFAWGMPRMVAEFIGKLSLKGHPYIFAAATCVAIPGNTLRDLQKDLRQRGVDLQAGFVVKAGRSSLMKLNSLDKIIIRLDRKRKTLRNSDERISEIVSTVKNLQPHRPETSSPGANLFGSMFHDLALKSFKTIDSAFLVNDSCEACGHCARICPRSNIIMENNHPVFQNNCELCHACIQWCPNFAIRHPNFDGALKQYRNPGVKMTDLITT